MSETVHAFFSQWDIYRLCIDHNTLFHHEVGEILHHELLERDNPFTFLDLACGDADLTATALRETKVSAYTGVDFSAAALALAANKIAELTCPRAFAESDFTHFLQANDDHFDVIYLGLSLHHLERAAKRETMKHLHRATAPGGTFYLFEPILQTNESREEYIERWARAMDGPYDAFPVSARDALREHVRVSERPETPEEYLSSARDAGFATGEILFTEPSHRFYSLFRFRT